MQRHQMYYIFVCLPSTQYILATDLAPQNKPRSLEESFAIFQPYFMFNTQLFVCLSPLSEDSEL